MLALFNIFGRTPKAVEDFAVQLFGSKASVVMTNVAGPMDPLYLAGVPIDRVMFWVPHPGKELGMGISILSYKGYATLAVIADAHLVPDPEAITERFHREFASLQAAVRRREEKMAAAGKPPRKEAAKARAKAGKSSGARSADCASTRFAPGRPEAWLRPRAARGYANRPDFPTCARWPPPGSTAPPVVRTRRRQPAGRAGRA